MMKFIRRYLTPRGAAGASLIITGIAGVVASRNGSGDIDIVVVVLSLPFLIPGCILLFRTAEQVARSKAEKQRRFEEKCRHFSGKHVMGLPVAEGITCQVDVTDDCVMITGGGVSFRIGFDRITDMQVMRNVEVHREYYSSTGGAVAGAMAFGTAGALIGGRVRGRTVQGVDSFFVVTYFKENEIAYVCLEVFGSDDTHAEVTSKKCKPKFVKQESLREL